MAERILADRYELESKIGSGGMGTVWKARDRLLHRTVAVKILHEGLASDASFSERFRREARSAASLGHPNIVAVYDSGEDPGEHGQTPFIVMEYVEGRSLHQLLNREGPLPVEDVARIGRSVLHALAHAHSRGLVHRDMKPANVLFDSATRDVKVVDLGIAKGLEDTGGLTRTSGLIGTAAYLSPEQVDGGAATPSSDLYAVGCLLYACLAGDPPFTGTTPVAIAMRHLRDPVPPLRTRRPDVPEDLEAAIMRALEKDPARRFSSAAEMDAAIARTGLDSRPATPPAVVPVPADAPTVAGAMREHPVGGATATEALTAPRPARSYAWLPALTAFLVVAAAAAVAVLWLQSRPTRLEEATLPTPTPLVTQAPTTAPTPTPSVEPTADPDDATPEPTPCTQLPGIDLPCPQTPVATVPPTSSPPPTPT